MPAHGLTGTRIRERRQMLQVRQAALARTVGISASYLNLIEHNRRRIGGKLLAEIADALSVEPGSLAEGADASLVTALRNASADQSDAAPETGRAEEFAGRFPGWASLVSAQHRRIGRLERTVEALTDRMAHDPHLAASLHELLSTVAAINSAASILVETDGIEDEWRDRFHRNIHEDSARLAESSRTLAAYLDSADQEMPAAGTPQEELERWLCSRDYHIAELERALPADPAAILRYADQIVTGAGHELAMRHMERYRSDAECMPQAGFTRAAVEAGWDPAALAKRFGADPAAVLRRIASLPAPAGTGPAGLVICDGSGTLTFRKPVDGFPLPRFGAACTLWPLYQALSHPMAPMRSVVEMSGRDPLRFLIYSVAQPAGPVGFDHPLTFEATMLILPKDRVQLPELPVLRIGTNCRICPRTACEVRREPSILADSAP